MKILIIGGNRFVGKRLAKSLVAAGHTLSILNRGNIDDGLGNDVVRIKADRNDAAMMANYVRMQTFDLVYDFVCYNEREAKSACDLFKGHTKRYIFISSQSVYQEGELPIAETQFNPHRELEVVVTPGMPEYTQYAEGKRAAERTFFQEGKFPVVAVRFPVILGQDDESQRLAFHVNKVKIGEEIFFPNPNAKLSLISSEDAASALFFLATQAFVGPINVCSKDPIELKTLMELIASKVGKPVVYGQKEKEGAHSPFGVEKNWAMDATVLLELGFQPKPILDWLPGLISTT